MLVIRMQRTGRKGHAMFRVVVQDSRRTPTSGKVVASLGSYDPHTKNVILKKEKAQFYLDHGAQPSSRVIGLLKAEGVKLPAWVKQADNKKRAVRNADKRRSTRPDEPEAPAATAEAATSEPAASEAPTDMAPETPAEETLAVEPEATAKAPAEEAAAEAPAEEAATETPSEEAAATDEPAEAPTEEATAEDAHAEETPPAEAPATEQPPAEEKTESKEEASPEEKAD